MSSLYLTLIAVLLSGLGARDQVTIAALTEAQGQRLGVLAIGLVSAVATAAFAAWAAIFIIPMLAPDARVFLGALALGLAGGESLIVAPRRKPKEPTHSLGALAFVVVAQQMTDAARFLIFGIAVASNAPFAVGVGGAIGGMALVGAAWGVPGLCLHPRTRLTRRIIGGVLVVIALIVGLQAIGMLAIGG